jgi:hypothetical protein
MRLYLEFILAQFSSILREFALWYIYYFTISTTIEISDDQQISRNQLRQVRHFTLSIVSPSGSSKDDSILCSLSPTPSSTTTSSSELVDPNKHECGLTHDYIAIVTLHDIRSPIRFKPINEKIKEYIDRFITTYEQYDCDDDSDEEDDEPRDKMEEEGDDFEGG